jgi:hypothetical protein
MHTKLRCTFNGTASKANPWKAILFLVLLLIGDAAIAGTCGVVDCLPRPSYPKVTSLQAYVIGSEWHVGAPITAIANVHLDGSCADACATFHNSYANIANVTFYVNGNPVCQAYTMVYSCQFFINTPGTYVISATAFSVYGMSGINSMTDQTFTVTL